MADDEIDRVVRIGTELRTLIVETEFLADNHGYPRAVVIEREDRTHVVEFSEHG